MDNLIFVGILLHFNVVINLKMLTIFIFHFILFTDMLSDNSGNCIIGFHCSPTVNCKTLKICVI